MNVPHWVVMEVTARPDYTLFLHFADGKTGAFNAAPLLEKPIYKSLQSPDFFLTAHVECGTVVWSDEVDIAPEYLYEHSKDTIVPVSTS